MREQKRARASVSRVSVVCVCVCVCMSCERRGRTFLGHVDEESCLHDAGQELDLLVEALGVGDGAEIDVDEEVSVVGHARTCLGRLSHAQHGASACSKPTHTGKPPQ
jgi:hypothetical protein